MTIYRDEVKIPSKSLQPDFASDRFIRSYLRLFTQTGQYIATLGTLFREDSTRTVVSCLLLISRLKSIQARSVSN